MLYDLDLYFQGHSCNAVVTRISVSHVYFYIAESISRTLYADLVVSGISLSLFRHLSDDDLLFGPLNKLQCSNQNIFFITYMPFTLCTIKVCAVIKTLRKGLVILPQIAKLMGPTWGPPGSCRPQMGPMLAPWTLLSGTVLIHFVSYIMPQTHGFVS